MQSTLQTEEAPQGNLHVAIIMDGNGRWANARNLPRGAGHRAGVEALKRLIKAAPEQGIRMLTVYAFSADNWRRPAAEVAALMRLLQNYLKREAHELRRNGIRLTAIGRRDRLSKSVVHAIENVENDTAAGENLHLRVALDYSGREAILNAAAIAADMPFELNQPAFSHLLSGHNPCPDVDLLIRTSGEQRLSDFLLWECAYAELYFTDCLWPDFGEQELHLALDEFRRRDRRFGGLAPDEDRQEHAGAPKSASAETNRTHKVQMP